MAKVGTGSETDSSSNRMLRDFFLGFIRVHLLHHASQSPLYGAWFTEELARHGYDVSPGTLYPLLHSMEKNGYLSRTDRVVDGKVRKYYEATALGRRALAEARPKIQELVKEIQDKPPRTTRRRVAAARKV